MRQIRFYKIQLDKIKLPAIMMIVNEKQPGQIKESFI